ncbi:hypothetical protein JCM3770_000127 [Rhodotorula araucariae]
MLRVWGCRAWHTVTHERIKLDHKAVPLIFIGYDGDTAAYRLLDPASRKIVRSRDARFVEHEFPLRESPAPSSGVPQQAVTPACDLFISPGVVAAAASERQPHTPTPPAAARAVPPAPARAQSELLFQTPPPACPHLQRAAAPPPSPDSPDLIDFLDDPFGATLAQVEAMLAGTDDSLRNEYHVFHAVDRSEVPADAKVLGCRSVYRRKKDQHGRVTGHKADVDKAYLHGELYEELYMRIPEGIDDPALAGKVLKLDRALYGLKQAGRVWNHRLHATLGRLSYMRARSDVCIYEEYGIKDLGEACFILGIQIHCRADGGVFLSQQAYLEDVLLRLGQAWPGCRTAPTPMIPLSQLRAAPEDHTPLPSFRRRYLQAVGLLMYAMLGTRPDLAHAVGVLGRHANRPDDSHWAAAIRVCQYLKGMLNYGIEYVPDDAPLPRVAALPTEAEYFGLSHASKEAVFLRQLLGELGHDAPRPATLLADNQGANALSRDAQFHDCSAHRTLQFLSHIILRDGIEAYSSKTDKIKNWAHPKTVAHMLTLFYPETDVKSECANKTAVQILRQYILHQQRDWCAHLAATKYAMNRATNESTGFSPFDLVLAKVRAARDTLAVAKVRQAKQVNKTCAAEPNFKVGNLVMVDLSDCRSRYKTRGGDHCAAKLFARWDSPYSITASLPDDEYIIEKIINEKGSRWRRRFLVKWVDYPDSDNTWELLAYVEDTAALANWDARGG